MHSSLYSNQQRTGKRWDICSLNCILYVANQKSLSLDSAYLERNDIMSREPTILTTGGFTRAQRWLHREAHASLGPSHCPPLKSEQMRRSQFQTVLDLRDSRDDLENTLKKKEKKTRLSGTPTCQASLRTPFSALKTSLNIYQGGCVYLS